MKKKNKTKILRFQMVSERTGLVRNSINYKMRIGEFPQSIKIGKRAIGWLESEINDWISKKITKRGKNENK